MNNVRNIVTLSIAVGFGLAILTNADKAVKIIDSVSGAWFDLIRTVSGQSA